MSQQPSSTDNLVNAVEYYDRIDLPISDDPKEWSDEGFAQTLQQFLSDSPEDGMTNLGEQETSVKWLCSDDLSHWQGYPLEGYEAQFDGEIDPTHAADQISAQPTKDNRSQSSEPHNHLSKRARKRAALEARGIDFGTDFRKKEQVKEIDGVLHVYCRGQWKPAVYLKHNGRLVIDLENHPIRDWPIPLCLSSKVEAGRLEAMSRYHGNRISKRDFRARMPSVIVRRNGREVPPVSEHGITMRRIRFRDQAGLLSWSTREGSLGRKKALIQCIPADIMDQILATNDTSCFRDMTQEEMTFINRANRGLNPEKAGSRKLTENERERRGAVKDVILKDFEPINETAWPYMDSAGDDNLAISRARMKLGLPLLEPGHTRAFHEAPIDLERSQDHPENETYLVTQHTESTCDRKKRMRDEAFGFPNADDGGKCTKRQCDSAELGQVGADSSNPSLMSGCSPKYMMPSDYDHEARNYAQYLNFKPRPAPRATPHHEPFPGKPNFAHNILHGQETREVDIAKGGMTHGSIALAAAMNPFKERHSGPFM
ncbi:MAG: hypothetical protein Q9188_004342 [Gyalolechia gomerana]